jgi:aquaporin Z
MWRSLQKNWQTYLIEAGALGTFMISASFFSDLWLNQSLPFSGLISYPILKRFMIGLAIGSTAVLIIYSKWGKKSGAHLNPAATLTHLQLHRIHPYDAFWYILAQFTGGALGIFIFSCLDYNFMSSPDIQFIATMPKKNGIVVAFLLEFLMSFVLFLTVLILNNRQRFAPYTGFFVGAIITLYITFEAPYSGMSMNPARTFASALAANNWTAWYIYFTAPVLGMNLAGYLYRKWYRRTHNNNCLTMNCHQSGQQGNNKIYEVLGPKWMLENNQVEPSK